MVKHGYSCQITFIGDESESAYEAIIPAFNNAVVYGENLSELEEGISFMIESEIQALQKSGKEVPVPDSKIIESGKIALRIDPRLHHKLRLLAKAKKISLNRLIEEKLMCA